MPDSAHVWPSAAGVAEHLRQSNHCETKRRSPGRPETSEYEYIFVPVLAANKQVEAVAG